MPSIKASAADAAARLECDQELRSHLESLGLQSIEEYTAWCSEQGFSTRVEKHWRDRCKERYLASQQQIKERLARKKRERRKPRHTLEKILDGEFQASDLTQPYLLLVHQLAASTEDPPTRAAFRALLLYCESCTGLLSRRPGWPQFGEQPGNTFLEGLLALARHQADWIRPLARWRPRTHNVRRQFSSLARHLLAQHPAPAFVDSVWFKSPSDEATRQQGWYKALVRGMSPRRLDLPIPLNKRMANHFLRAPEHFSVDSALLWGQVHGLGGNAILANAVLGTRIALDFANNEFWLTVLRWLIRNPLFDPAQIGPLVDYIYRQRFEPQEIDLGDGRREVRPADPDFSMKGRTGVLLLRQMQLWHAELRARQSRPQTSWDPSGIGPFDWAEGNLTAENLRRWTIIELLSRKALYDEGQTLRHCVASYDNSCAFGGSSIWSLGVARNLGRRRRVLTIEVTNATRKIGQIRGKANRLPTQKELAVVQRWAAQEGLVISQHVAAL